MFVPRLRRWRTVRTCACLALGASTTVTALHGIQLYGLDYMLEHSGLRWYLLELAIYAGGVALYAVGLRCHPFQVTRIDLTRFYSLAVQNVSHLVFSIFGGARTKYSMLLSSAQCTYMYLL